LKLISEVTIDHFRSIRSKTICDLGHFTAFAGLNNSGKSNVLRALHAFFSDQTDIGVDFDFSRDYYCHDFKAKKAKRISISVKFDLPSSFKFRKGLEPVENLLGRSFTLRKTWMRNNPLSSYYLNSSNVPVSHEQRALIEQFLSLVTFRYIPNRVLPLDIIRDEHRALRDVLVRRLAKKAKSKEDIFKSIGETSATLIKSLQSSIHEACPEIGSIRLATPTSWQDLIFAFGYKLKMDESELDDSAQGSGIQSFLMLETLSLIDRDYFQKFGWKQAAIWAVEEPESSLHTSLEARVAAYLADLANETEGRLQILGTTHSDLMLQSADRTVFVSMSKGESSFGVTDKRAVLQEAARLGISRWTHPIHCNPLQPLILVEGKFDWAFLEEALKTIAQSKEIIVSYLEQLQGGGTTGGVDALLQYIRANAAAIKARVTDAPVIILLDWDAAKKEVEFKKSFGPSDPCKVLVWPETAFNPKLGKAFHGIERHMSDRIVDRADSVAKVLGTKKDGSRTVSRDDYGAFKEEVFKVVKKGLKLKDLQYSKAFLDSLLNLLP